MNLVSRQKKEILKPFDRIAAIAIGLILTPFILGSGVWLIVAIIGPAFKGGGGEKSAIAATIIYGSLIIIPFSYLTFWSARHTYYGFKGYRYVKEILPKEVLPTDRSQEASLKEKWGSFGFFFGVSLLEVLLLLTEVVSIANWMGWLILTSAIIFSIMSVISLISIINHWSIEKEESIVEKIMGFLVGTPVVLVLILVAIALLVWAAISVFGWFGSIPSWAAVIIVLLILLLFKR